MSVSLDMFTDMSVLKERLIPRGVERDKWDQMPLMEKFKTSYHLEKDHVMQSKWPSRGGALVFWYTTITQLYCSLKHIIPEYFEDSDDMTKYYLKVFITFILIQGSANWLCVKLFDTSNKKTRDNPDPELVLHQVESGLKADVFYKKSQVKTKESLNGSVEHEKVYEDKNSDRNGLVWGYCDICDIPKPPRSHHCKVCNLCILKRDHHCFFTDSCVGYYNQRYFVILNFYIAIASAIGIFYDVMYLKWKLGAESSYWDYFLPNAVYKWWFGLFPVHMVYMVSHLYIMWWAGIMALGFFITQLSAIIVGKTTQEIFKHQRIRCTSSSDVNFRSVFGAFWGTNFFFPAVLIFRQDGDGKHWNDLKIY